MKLKIIQLIFSILFFFALSQPVYSQNNGTINLISEDNVNKFAPGEFLTFSLKLVNFGSVARQDVIVTYQIVNSQNNEVYSSSETVAVDTTASFIKRIPLSNSLELGKYTLSVTLIYPGQQQVAVSTFDFTLDSKIGGYFTSDLIIYGLSLLLIFFAIFLLLFFLIRKVKKNRVEFFDYNDKPKNEIVFYEILSDMISQMRLRIGDSAIELAQDIPELEIDSRSGKVINIKKSPAKVIALIIQRFEAFSGRKLSFGLRPKNNNFKN